MIEEFINKLNLNTTYSLLIKFSFAGNKLFYMAGKQSDLVIGNKHNKLKYRKLHIINIFNKLLFLEYPRNDLNVHGLCQ